jgi:hypothetical protein
MKSGGGRRRRYVKRSPALRTDDFEKHTNTTLREVKGDDKDKVKTTKENK